MPRKKTPDTGSLAAKLVGGRPLDFHLRKDGSLVVIGPEGRKYRFTAAQVRAAQDADRQTTSPGKD